RYRQKKFLKIVLFFYATLQTTNVAQHFPWDQIDSIDPNVFKSLTGFKISIWFETFNFDLQLTCWARLMGTSIVFGTNKYTS
ncbi:hypothetical protein ACJX0J_020644, partial [Zea mays]